MSMGRPPGKWRGVGRFAPGPVCGRWDIPLGPRAHAGRTRWPGRYCNSSTEHILMFRASRRARALARVSARRAKWGRTSKCTLSGVASPLSVKWRPSVKVAVAWATILHVIDGTLLLWISHLHGTVEQGLPLPGEEQLYRPLNAVVTLGQHAFGALGDVNDRLVE